MSIKNTTTDSLAGAIGQVVPILLNLVFTSFFIAGPGVENFGFYSESILLMGYLMILDFALVFPIMRNAGKLWHKGDLKGLNLQLNNNLGVYLMIGVLGAVVFWIGSGFFSKTLFGAQGESGLMLSYIFKITGINFLGQVMLNWGKNVLNGLGKIKLSNLFFISYPTLWGLVSILILLTELDWLLIFWIKGISAILIGIIQILSISRIIGNRVIPSLNWSGTGLKKSDLPKGLSIRLNDQVFIRYDQFLIGAIIGAETLGIYSVAFLIPNAVLLVLYKMNEFVVHGTTKLIDKSDDLFSFFKTGASIFGLISIATTITLISLGQEILDVWVGQEIGLAAMPYLTLLAIGMGITGAFAPFGIPFLLGSDMFHLLAQYKWSKSASLFLFVSIGMWHDGALGAAYGVLASGVIDLYFFFKTSGKIGSGIGIKVFLNWILALALGLVFYFCLELFFTHLGFENPFFKLGTGVILAGVFWLTCLVIGPWVPVEIRKKILKFVG